MNSAGGVIYRKFTTRNSSAIPTTFGGSPVISIYKNNSLSQIVTGVTLTIDFDGVTGLNHVTIDTSTDTTFYANDNHYDLVVTSGSVAGNSIVGEAIGSFDLVSSNVISGTSDTSISQSQYIPGAAYYAEFTISSAIGSAVNADSLPVATANHNGIDDSGFVLTVTNVDVGRYKVTGTVPLTYVQYDSVWISVSATIASVATKGVVDRFVIGTPSNVVSGICQAGSTSSTIKLASTADSITDNIYRNQTVLIYGGTGIGQTALITGYTASSRVATITPNWLNTLDATSMYVLLPTNVVSLASTAFSNIKEATNTYDLKQIIIMVFEACIYSKINGLPTGPAIIRDFADTLNRATISFDSNNNRTNVVINNAP